MRVLKHKLGALNAAVEAQIQGLSVELLEQLHVDLLDFSGHQDLQNWLDQHQSQH